MKSRFYFIFRFSVRLAGVVAVILFAAWISISVRGASAAGPEPRAAAAPAAIKGPMCNIDDTVFFWGAAIPKGKAGETVDRYVDGMAAAGAGVLLCCTNARRTNYRTRVWDAYWDGYDPTGPDSQSFFAAVPKQEVRDYRRLVDNMWLVDHEGIDYPARMIERCRHDGISPWITLRMNDCHFNNISDHPFHGSFWKNNPQYARKNCPGYFATCLDYAHPAVRDFYKALVAEVLDRYDMDGLELDFMRECYLFSAGKEAEGMPVLTAWLGDVRKLVDAAAAKRGHSVRLGVRVPSRPEVASGWGLDVATWVKKGLIDVLVATPRWATLELDMPLEQWRKLLDAEGDSPMIAASCRNNRDSPRGTSKVTLAGGLEILYRPFPGGPATTVSPALARGAAVNVLAGGADAVYLFNYFQDSDANWPTPVYRTTLRAMSSLEALLKLPRSVGITYRDITAPGEAYQPLLPARGDELRFPMRVGPLPVRGACVLLIEFAPLQNKAFATPVVHVNGKPCAIRADETTKDGRRVVSFVVPPAALSAIGSQEITVAGKAPHAAASYRVERLEMAFGEQTGGPK
jgi:hypothetical protein